MSEAVQVLLGRRMGTCTNAGKQPKCPLHSKDHSRQQQEQRHQEREDSGSAEMASRTKTCIGVEAEALLSNHSSASH